MSQPESRIENLESRCDEIEERLSQVEKGKFEKVTANTLSVRDQDGNVRALLHCTEDHGVVLGFAAKDETPRLALAVFEEPGVHLYSPDGETLASLKLDEDGCPQIVLHQSSSMPAVLLTVSQDTPHLLLFDQEPRLRVGLSVEGGVANLTLHDVKERARFVVASEPDRALLAILDSEGRTVEGMG